MEKRSKTIKMNPDWYVPIILLIVGIFVYTVYWITKSFQIIPLLEILGCWLVSLIIPILNMKVKHRCSITINVLIAILIVIGGYLGGALAFYDRFAYWDTFCHTFFGIVSGAIFIYLIHLFEVERMNLFAIALFELAFTLGLAGIWELFEFACDCMLDTDFQKIALSLEQGRLPQWDTMMDMLVAFLGSIIHYVWYIVYRQIRLRKNKANGIN
ncbi:MAG: hypothetical protein NC182_00110 [Prevotella sp.]|nr:hypothetical protein [Staphylococcus sp.]MCM1349588.1 hypothetical protein [Prevotella sp.]